MRKTNFYSICVAQTAILRYDVRIKGKTDSKTRKLICTFLLLTVSLATSDQVENPEAKRFVRYVLRNYDRFAFAKREDSEIGRLKRALDADTLRSEEKHHHEPDRLLVLTEAERDFITSELLKPSTAEDYSRLLEAASTVPVDSLKTTYYYDKERNGADFKGKDKTVWHTFSIPIFIRSNALCVL